MKKKYLALAVLSCSVTFATSTTTATAAPAAAAISAIKKGSAISDMLLYDIGGGSVISQPPSVGTKWLGIKGGWNVNLGCGGFDVKTTVANQLNGVTDGFKDMMGSVIQNATGAVASLPGMIIQRANPGLYDMLQNGVLQAGIAFDKSKLSCENMAKQLAAHTLGSEWAESAAADEYKEAVKSSGGDVVRAEKAKDKATGEEGSLWIGGSRAGGKGQPPIKPVHDLSKAGYNILNNLDASSSASVSGNNCKGSACRIFKNSDEAAKEIVRVLGDTSIRTCKDESKCGGGGGNGTGSGNGSGNDGNNGNASVAGIGLGILVDEAIDINLQALNNLVNSHGIPSADELAKLKTGGLSVTRGVIEALRDDNDKQALVSRIAGELAIADTIETALAMRRILLAGESEPHAAVQKQAITEGDRRIDQLDRELASLKNEMELRRAVSSNAILTALLRQQSRNDENEPIKRTDNGDTQAFERIISGQKKGDK